MTSEIILIEDSESDAEIVLRALKRSGITHTVKHFSDGEKALDYFFGKKGETGSLRSYPKLIFVDLKMPKIDGLEFIKIFKADEHMRTIPLVVLTSSKENKDINDAYKLGINSYIVKSADYEGFSKLVVDSATYWLLINTPPVNI